LYDDVNVNKKVTNVYRPLEAKIGPEDPIIPGLKEGLKLLELGDKATIFIPYHLAYGETGRGRMVPPKTNLIFEVEIVEIK
jgi:peptidylprolyl isomerase